MTERNESKAIHPLAVILGCMLYILSPIDLLPDVFPIIGQGDDLAVLIFLIRYWMDYKRKGTVSLQPESSESTIIDVPAKMLDVSES